MIKKIRIKNFKSYGHAGADFDLAKINFIYGDNSVGKSSFLQFLQMVIAGIDHQERYSKEDFDRHLFKMNHQNETTNFVSGKIRVVTEDGADQKVYVIDFKPIQGSDSYGLIAPEGVIVNEAFWDSVLPKGEGQARIMHIEAPRSRSSAFGEKHDSQGKSALEASSFANKVDTESHGDAKNYLNNIFERLRIRYSCVDSADGNLSSTRIHDDDFDIDVDIQDVGTGIAGLVQLAFTLKDWKGGILALEEPETNVNENQLEALTQVLVEEAKKRKFGQLIVECHSKLMVMKLASLVRAGKLVGKGAERNLSVLEVAKTAEGSRVQGVEIDSKGVIKWPTDYFPAEGLILAEMYGT